MKPEKYLAELASKKSPNDVSDEEVNALYNKLISCLPKTKRLYKYRALSCDYFDKLLKNFEEGTIYLSNVGVMNDRIDTTFVYKTLTTDEEVLSYFQKNRFIVFYHNIKGTNHFNKTDERIIELLARNQTTTAIINALQSKNKGTKYVTILKRIQSIKKAIDDYFADSSFLQKMINHHRRLNDLIRNDYYICSLSAIFDQDSMWAYYANNNEGFCVVYDFKKGLKFSIDKKRDLLTTFKVIYSDRKEKLDMEAIYDSEYKNEFDPNLNYKANKVFLTKRTSWSHEQEWRISSSKKQIIHADLVVGFIIDESVINEERAKQLILLAETKRWFIRVRTLNKSTYKFEYPLLKKYNNHASD